MKHGNPMEDISLIKGGLRFDLINKDKSHNRLALIEFEENQTYAILYLVSKKVNFRRHSNSSKSDFLLKDGKNFKLN